ncbi:DNA polymerase processivity factor [Psittacid alphaherpesvirus 5]|uniref:DNA polymerase processivity factor n=1 Tax=Psittacid alphaherpesvirus 5 TaxID=2972693 RepID=A0A5P9JRX0_9ALPH|nr:DNA polymerase processivity factor [Psittacid alphaherpesvirus 5]QFU14578.1 DNA polymerase processivity factor [Psittacid alphaherpesvirus 5]UOO01049.1 DNA polymerase processivity factor [Psittacid alphaherpesvirus 5]
MAAVERDVKIDSKNACETHVFRVVLGSRGYEIITKVLRSIRPALTDAVIAITDCNILIHAAAGNRLTYVRLDWPLFEEYELLSDETSETEIYFLNSLKPRQGCLLDFLTVSAKQAKKDPFVSATFTVSYRNRPEYEQSDSPAEYILTVEVVTENGRYTRFKRSAVIDSPIREPCDTSCATILLESYAYTEMLKWLSENSRKQVHLLIDDSVFSISSATTANDNITFGIVWPQISSQHKTSSMILSHIARARGKPSKRTVERQIKEERILGAMGERKVTACVTVDGGALRSALTWMKIAPWGIPSVRFFDTPDKKMNRAVEIVMFGRYPDSIRASILFMNVDTNKRDRIDFTPKGEHVRYGPVRVGEKRHLE